MKRTLLCLFTFLSFFLRSQNSIIGSVVDSTKAPIPFCAMALMNAKDSSLVKGNVADSAGGFIFEKIKPGNYFIKFSNVGFNSASSASFVVDSTSQITLPEQILKAQGVNLKEVAVTAYKPAIEFKKGMVVMNVEDDILARGNTVLDLIKRIPGVMIDAQNNITISGASGVRFMIDDRMQQMPNQQVMDMLGSMSADVVSKIELIKNPPARYDAAGTAGLINIVTKKAKVNGYNGSLSFGASYSDVLRFGPNGSFNYKSNKLSVFSNLSYGYWDAVTYFTLNRNMTANGNTERVNSYGIHKAFQRVITGGGGIEYDINKTTLVGLYANTTIYNDSYVNTNTTTINNSSFFNYAKTIDRADERYDNAVPNVNLSLLKKIDTIGGKIKLSVGFNDYLDRNTKSIVNHFYDVNDAEISNVSGYYSKTRSDYIVYTGKLDLNKTFKNKLTLESGLSANIEDDRIHTKLDFTNQSTGFFVGDTSFYNIYNFRQNILAAYSTISRDWDKVGFSVGLRAENTDVNIDYKSNNYLYSRNYLSLFPSGSFDVNFDKKNALTLTYSYRIRRPFYDMLNPVRQFNHQLNYNVGNPEIRPQFSHHFNLDYSYNQFITVSTSYDETKDFTFWYSYTPNSSRVKIDTISNLPRFTSANVTLSAQKRIKWYSFQTFAMVTHQTFEGKLVGYDVTSKTYQVYFNLNQEFYLPGDWKIQIWCGRGSALRHGPQVYLPRSAVHVSVNKAFLDQKLNVTLGLNDVLYKDYFSYTTTYSDQDFYQKNRSDSRRIRLTLSYRFGKMQIQQRLKEEKAQGARG